LAAVWELIDWSKVSEKYTSALANASLLDKLKPQKKKRGKRIDNIAVSLIFTSKWNIS